MTTDTYALEYHYERFYEGLADLNRLRASKASEDKIENARKALQEFADNHELDAYLEQF